MSKKSVIAEDLINFINNSPTPYAGINELKARLDAAGAKEVCLSDITPELADGGLYYTVSGDSCIAAFIKGNCVTDGINIAAAHIDFPVLKIKPSGVTPADGGIGRINVETYGGLIHHTWLDRPLKIAGRVACDGGNGEVLYADIDTKETMFIIPNVDIHLVRDINDGAKFSVQNDLLPYFSLGNDSTFADFLAKTVSEAIGKELDADSVLSFDLSLVDAAPACFTGINDEFVSAPGLDDRAMVHAAFTALCNSSTIGAGRPVKPSVAFAFNHEECGSLSSTGAMSNFSFAVTKALCNAASNDFKQYNDAEFWDIMQKSFALSCDMAHAFHPSHASKFDTNNKVVLGGGVVLKTVANQSYSTSVAASGKFVSLCKKAGVPYQNFSNNSDARSGATIGPMIAAALGVCVADIGNAMLAMHSSRELCASSDQEHAYRLFEEFFKQY